MAKTMLIIIFFIESLLISQLDDVLCIISKPNSNPPINANGFSIDIFHRDSLHSPYYNESLSHTQTLVNAIRRSLNRSQWLNESLAAGSTETDVVRSIHSGDYLMRYAIGQQRVPSLGILDTGSSLIWTQCFPCRWCIKQNPPLYEPGKSSTYKVILCNEFECNRSSYANMCRQKQVKTCVYASSYEDGTLTVGKLSKDTFILSSAGGTTTYVYDMVFGCSSRAQSNFYGYESGVIGLGRGNHSLVSQLRDSAKGKFSYCLVPKQKDPKGSSSSRLSFGESAEVSGVGVVHTPLLLNPNSTYYHVTLFGFDIGGTKKMYASNEGNMIVDSGWAETRIPDEMYVSLKSSLIDALKLKVIDDPERTLDLCFYTKSDRFWLPTVTLHFGGDDANVSFGRENMFVRTSPYSLCLAVLPAGDEGIVVLGYIAQANFVVGYDTEKNQMSFKPTDCANSPN